MAETKITNQIWSDEELRAKVGQLFIVGFHGHVPSEDIKKLITVYKVGAVVLFQRNVNTGSQLLGLTKSLQDIARQAGHSQDLFIGIDQENGLVTRIKPPVAAQLPGPMALAATGDPSNAYKSALATAETLKNFGINFNYAPIADVNSEPKNPVIGVRSPSDDPEVVGRFVSAQIKGLTEGGIVPCVKHFPGHGGTAVDSHYGLPVISKSRVQLDACELAPFRRAVVESVNAVMTAHIALPGIRENSIEAGHPLKKLPASLNPDAIKILREDMKYGGLIVSDCLEMDSVRATYGTEKGAVMALKAGTDCVMICHTMAVQVGAIEIVVQAVKSGELLLEAIEKSANRVKELKIKYLSDTSLLTIIESKSRISKQSALASEVYAKSTTVVRCDPGSFPIPVISSKMVFISPGEVDEGGGAIEIGEEKTREPYTPVTYIDLLRVHNPDILDVRFTEGVPLSPESEKDIEDAKHVILATRNASLSLYQKEFGLSLAKRLGSKLILVATCDPYDFLQEKAAVNNYVTIYEPTIPAFKAAVDVIFGKTKASGILPVGNNTPKHDIQILSRSDTQSIRKLWVLWQEIFPKWPIGLERLTKLLQPGAGRHLLHAKGFCLSFIFDGGMGKISAVGVLPDFRGKGLGTSLITKAQEQLRLSGDLKTLGIGSSFPRFWAGLPIDISQEYKDFFLHRGFHKSIDPTARDMFRDITIDVAPAAVLEKVSNLPLKFAPWSPEMYEECMTKQRANFHYNKAWIKAYEWIAESNQHHEVMIAFDSETGAQVGWTLMCSHTCVICDYFAFLPLAPSKDKTGLIACVGVDKAARGNGVGLALLVRAMENMRERGIEGVLIDYVTIRGFYENLGFNQLWEYDGYDW